jgi:hypothetical protein
MKTFTDSAGRVWTLQVTVSSIKRVKSLAGVNLCDLNDGEPPLIARLESDLILLFDVIFSLVKPQADAAGVTDEQFAQAMGAPAAGQAVQAFWEELVDFFQSARPLVAELILAGRELREARTAALAALKAERLAALAGENRSGSLPGSSPASSESTPVA